MTETAIPDDPAPAAEPVVTVEVSANSPQSAITVSGGDAETEDARSARQRIVDHLLHTVLL